MRRLLVTAALPYANGHIHIGHIVEYVQTESGSVSRNCVAGDASTSAPTTRTARHHDPRRQEGIREEDWIATMQQAHLSDFQGFQIEFDNYGSTNTRKHGKFVSRFGPRSARPGWSRNKR